MKAKGAGERFQFYYLTLSPALRTPISSILQDLFEPIFSGICYAPVRHERPGGLVSLSLAQEGAHLRANTTTTTTKMLIPQIHTRGQEREAFRRRAFCLDESRRILSAIETRDFTPVLQI